ncbi:MAG TPA: hypothetical protein VLA90_05790 [Actinomycetota bacterium]|nr:hypothetical protein [Actinomycetota bacterium]
MFEDIFGPRLPEGIEYGSREHHAWDMDRARQWLIETLEEARAKREEIDEGIATAEGMMAKEPEASTSGRNASSRSGRRGTTGSTPAGGQSGRSGRSASSSSLSTARRVAPSPPPRRQHP